MVAAPARDAEAVLATLDPEQRAAASAISGPVCILAGAGTGKTRTITHRIAYGVLTGRFAPDSVLAVTFTTRAAGELRARLRALGATGVQARTFHSAALRQLQFFWPRVVGGDLPRLVDRKLRIVAEVASKRRLGAATPELRDLASEIEWAKATLVAPSDYAEQADKARRSPPRPPAEVAAVYADYEQAKGKAGVLDFEDLLLVLAGILDEHPDVAAQVRGQYRHFVVDEYQDVNPLQQRLLDCWLGGRDELCVVGDAQQTIYSFTGASADYLLRFPQRFPDATVVQLVRDYRSTPQVVGLANKIIAKAPARGPRLELRAQRDTGPDPTYAAHPDEVAEAAGTAARVKALLDKGVPAREIAVLFRTNGQSQSYEQALAELDIPYVLRGGERFFERREIREAIALLRAAARSPSADAPMALPQTVRHVLAAAGWSAQPPAGTGAARERWESLSALAGLADELVASDANADLPLFLADLEARVATQHAPPIDGVTLASLHAAKGLEWDAVFLVGLTDGMVPITHAETPAEIEEERRLLYVGITRARVHLTLSWSLARSPGGRGSRRPSRFLDGLVSAATASTAPRASARSRKGPPPCRVCGKPLMAAVERKLGRCEGCPADLDEALFDRLRAWRLDRAKERGQPAFCVFTDATLQAIAESRPASVAELVKIPGVGKRKLDDFGADVLALVCGDG